VTKLDEARKCLRSVVSQHLGPDAASLIEALIDAKLEEHRAAEHVCVECSGAKFVCDSNVPGRTEPCWNNARHTRRPCPRCSAPPGVSPALPRIEADPLKPAEAAEGAPGRLWWYRASGLPNIAWTRALVPPEAVEYVPITELQASEAWAKELEAEVAELRRFHGRVTADVGAAIARHEAWQTELDKGGG
jgi:hypothetical protein